MATPAKRGESPAARVPSKRKTTEVSAVVVEEVGDVTRTDVRLVLPEETTLDPETRALILTCEAELATEPDPLSAARLHYEIAQAYEGGIGFLDDAARHYELALASAPDHVPTIRGARRVHIALARFDDALPLFDAEARLTRSASRRAMLHYEQGRLLEDVVGDAIRARAAYARALELDPSSVSILKALEQCDHRADDKSHLMVSYERAANAVSADARHRAALIVSRARLLERHSGDTGAAAELYESALKLDPHAIGALDALKRIYRASGQWRLLVTALEREARQSNTPEVRALALYAASRIHSERMQNRAEALAALAKAVAWAPRDPLILADLNRLYTEQEDYEALVEVLAVQVESAVDDRERLALLYNLGQAYEWALEDMERALGCYQSALEIDPTCVPVLQACGELLAKRWQWAEIIDMRLAEAAATEVPLRAANAHARAAEIFEVHLRDPAKAAEHHARALALVPGHAESFKALARLYSEAKQFRQLIELYERAILDASEPAIKLAYLFKVGRLWEDHLDDPAQALQAFGRALEVEPDNLAAIHAVQRVAERAERHQELASALEREVALSGDDARKVALLHRAGTVFDNYLNDRDAALLRFNRALDIDPQYIPALTSVGEIYYRTGRFADLLDIYRRQLDATPEQPARVALLFKMGELCEKQLRNDDDAIGYYQRAAELDPTHRPSLHSLARKLRERANWADLAGVIELEASTLANAEARAVAWYRVGQVYEERLSRPGDAISAYEKALDAVEDYRPAHEAIARLWADGGEWMKVVGALIHDATTAEEPLRVVNALLNQAEIYRDELGDEELATRCYEAALNRDVGRIPALLALEPLYARAGAWEKLSQVYAELGGVLAAPGARIAALRELARIQETKGLGGPRERLVTYDSILAIEPDDPAALAAVERIGQETRDPQILTRAYSRLANNAEHDSLAASYLTRLGQVLEQVGDRRALDAYRAALKKDPKLLTAIRGLSRVGDLLGNARAMSHSARLEAQLTRTPEMAAKLFVRAGTIRREQMNDLGAVEDFERALEVWPDDPAAAERIIAPLVDTGQIQHLVDVLSSAASRAKSPQRQTALWLEVGRLQANRLDNLGAAISALKHALSATPGHAEALSELAEAHEHNEQWGEAVAALEQVLALTSDDTVRCQAHLRLASIFDERLKNIKRARENVQAVLRKYPQHADALLRLTDIQLRSGDESEAVETAQKLVELARDPRKKGAALVRVARIQRIGGDDAAADEALIEALTLEGPGGDAEREFKKSIEAHGSWVGYAKGLSVHVERLRKSGGSEGEMAPAYLELAKVYAQGMNLPNKAIDTLRQGLAACGDGRLMRQLATQLREAGRPDEAVTQLQLLLGQEPTRPDSWQELALAFDKAGRRSDAARAMEALIVLGADSDAVRESVASRKARPARAADGSLRFETVRSLAIDGANASPAAKLLAAIAEGAGKIYPPSLESLGLSRRDRLGPRSGHPLWDLSVRIAQIFAAEFELYEHRMPKPVFTIEMTEPAAIVVSRQVRDLPVAQQTFLLSYAMMLIAGRIHPVIPLSSAQLEVLLVGATRIATPTFAARPSQDIEFDDAKERLRRGVPRKWRRAMELAAAEMAGDPMPDMTRWQWAVKQTAARAALLVADDLTASVDALRYVTDLGGLKGAALVHGSTVVRDLMQFWVSDRASTLRKRAKIAGK